MTKPQENTLKLIAQLLAFAVLVAGVAFAAGNYPTRGEWKASQEATSEEIDQLKEDAAEVRIEQVRLRSSMTNIEKSQGRSERTTDEIRKKLDEALEPSPRRR